MTFVDDVFAPFGAAAGGERLERIRRSPHFKDGAFQNVVPTRTLLPQTFWRTISMQVFGREQRSPSKPIPIVTATAEDFRVAPESGLRVTWLGHTTVLLEIDGRRLLFDPVWSKRVSPMQWLGPKRFFPPPLSLDALPPIDAVVLSHDHYDHLDMLTIQALATMDVPLFVAPLGVGAHLERWGVSAGRIVEADWGDSISVAGLTLTCTTARHFSGRGLRKENQTLWAAWVVAGTAHRVFFGGDSGFFEGFAEIGRRYGPFDLTVLAIGAYAPTWPQIHLTPEEAVQAHQMLGGGPLLPVHWGTFNLAFHAWDEPIERLLVAGRAAGLSLILPRPGERVEPALAPPIEMWWRG